MKAARIFRYVWRANGVIILLAGLWVLMLLATLSFELTRLHPDSSDAGVIVAEEPHAEEEKGELGRFHAIEDTTWFMAPLTFGEEPVYSCFGKMGSESSVRNYLFVDSNDLLSRWLFPDNKQLIWGGDLVWESADQEVLAVVYQVVASDTDGDGRLTGKDRADLVVSRPDGSGRVTAVQGIERQLKGDISEAGEDFVVLYEKDGKAYATRISAATLEASETKELGGTP